MDQFEVRTADFKPQEVAAFGVAFPTLSAWDWYAGQALAGTLARDFRLPHGAAAVAAEVADAMLKEREKRA